jgi:anhydro-N-acetylmuramic acid kinase
MKITKVIGVMSGTSLDGIDIAYCEFTGDKDNWAYKIAYAETIPYDEYWKKTLSDLENSTAFEFVAADTLYGHFVGRLVSDFIKKHNLLPDFIASHGHTIFHQPENKITSQIGEGAAIAAECGFPVVCDFRSQDVALGGQGAPLVPVGDKLLFASYDYCLNLGGFANISYDVAGDRIAFDICPVNIVLNKLARGLGKEYDHKGEIASEGKVNNDLLVQLNQIEYYKAPFPKSLGKEWVIKYFDPIVESINISIEDRLCTICEHIAMQVSKTDNMQQGMKMLASGGGAYNSFLIARLKHHCQCEIIIPDKLTIEYKEALIFAFLGLLRMKGSVNCLKSVTGASRDHSSGAAYLP